MATKKSLMRENVEALFVAIVLAIVVTNYGVQAYEIPSGSMMNTLLIGDRVLVDKVTYRFAEPQRGELIVFKFPLERPENFIKRVIGLPGDRLEIKMGQVYINDEPVDESSYLLAEKKSGKAYVHTHDNLAPILIPPRKYFVMGDNRDNSFDSRYWGFVDGELIEGRAFVIYWSRDTEKTLPSSFRWERFGSLL